MIFPEDIEISPLLHEVFKGVFAKDPLERWTADHTKSHAWLDVPRQEDAEEDAKLAAQTEEAE